MTPELGAPAFSDPTGIRDDEHAGNTEPSLDRSSRLRRVRPRSPLRALHERVHVALAEPADGPAERHRPGRWEPHCTVAWRLERRSVPAVVALLLEANALPLEATMTRVGLIETPAEVELGSLPSASRCSS